MSNEITRTIPKTDKSLIDYLCNRNSNSVFLSPTTLIEVNQTILNLDQTKSTGPYSIPIKVLKILGPKISHSLTKIINQSFTEGSFPIKLKIAKVISIFKRGDLEIPSNYRPISLLPICSKIFEKLMYERMLSFLKQHKVIYPMQFGFRENHCIDHALTSITEDIRSTLDNKRYGCGFFIDLQKDFDTASDEILLKKLEHYGVRGSTLKWFHSYLSDRNQFVSINGHDSTKMEISCGVPQGSVLGPLLFLIFINDMPNTSNKIKIYLFTDDTYIYVES